jgi:hypothetical protein
MRIPKWIILLLAPLICARWSGLQVRRLLRQRLSLLARLRELTYGGIWRRKKYNKCNAAVKRSPPFSYFFKYTTHHVVAWNCTFWATKRYENLGIISHPASKIGHNPLSWPLGQWIYLLKGFSIPRIFVKSCHTKNENDLSRWKTRCLEW